MNANSGVTIPNVVTIATTLFAVISCGSGPSLHIDGAVLRVGQSARVQPVGMNLPVTFFTTDEHSAVVEPNGVVTAIGFNRERDSVVISATTGKTQNTFTSVATTVRLRPSVGPPSLMMATNRDTPGAGRFACCTNPAITLAGSTVRFRVWRMHGRRNDITRDKNTKYVLFFGSGIPDDTQPQRIIGEAYSTLSAKTFTISPSRGTICVPTIGTDIWRDVVVFFRNRGDVGWKDVIIRHP